MRELSSAARLAAWGGAALTGAVSPDDAADEVCGTHDPAHRVVGLPGEAAAVNLAYALARLGTLGATGLRLVLPRPGDVAGLPGPPAFNERAVEAGEAVLTVGCAPLALLPASRGTWSVHEVELDPRTPMQPEDAGRQLGAVIRDAAALLTRLDLARWDPAAADALAHRSRSVRPALPDSVPASSHTLLQQALRIASVVTVARSVDGAAVSAAEMATRTRVLDGLAAAARRVVEATCSTAPD